MTDKFDKDLLDILAACSQSTRTTALTFFPERFNVPFAEEVHGKIFDLIDDPTLNKVAIAAPRGWGKTSIVALALMARHILFRVTDFIAYINMSHDAAALQTENLRRELVSNPIIKKIFGQVKVNLGNSEFEETFSKKAWVAYDTLVWPRGAGQQVRGVLYRNSRPALIVLDDLENTENITNEDFRKKQREWLYADVMPAVPKLHKNWKIVYIDTLKHEDSVLQHLLESPDWASVRLEACDDNFKPTAEHFMSQADLTREWESHQQAGQTDVFFREFRNLPISTKDASFQKDYFRYYNVPQDRALRDRDLSITDDDIASDERIENIVIVDPAKTVKLHSAESAIVGLGLDLANARIYVRDVVSDKLYPDELYDAIFGMAARINAMAIGIEDTSLNEFIKQPIKSQMFWRKQFYNLTWLKPRGGLPHKEGRVKALVPFYRLGYIYHNLVCPKIAALEAQLLMFPRSKLWDIMDALAYVIQMLEMGERYFMPDQDLENPEDQYKDLSYDKPVADWRYA
jgi:hypothetical protein